jgi:hypothetical protein
MVLGGVALAIGVYDQDMAKPASELHTCPTPTLNVCA